MPAASRSVRIPTPSKFNFAQTVVSHGWYHLAPFRWDAAAKTLHRIELLAGRPLALAITHTRGALEVSGARDSGELRTKLTRMFQLDVELSEFLERTRSSPVHAWVEPAGFGRLLCGATPFEDAVKIILTTNTMWRQTVRMNELLVQFCGAGLKPKSSRATEGGGHHTEPGAAHAFPRAEEVVRFDAETLQRECRLGYRAKSIVILAQGIVSGGIDLASVGDRRQTTAELFASYRTLPGIGPYGAAHLLAMDGRHDFIAVDTEFRRFVRERYHGGRKVADATLLRRYAKWGRWKYLAYWAELWEGHHGA
jgi:3-methyladenine DNA glycosylase/8-oxoguanine DNA glycosylase